MVRSPRSWCVLSTCKRRCIGSKYPKKIVSNPDKKLITGADQCFYFQNYVYYVLDTLIQTRFLQVIKMNTFRGDPTILSAVINRLVQIRPGKGGAGPRGCPYTVYRQAGWYEKSASPRVSRPRLLPLHLDVPCKPQDATPYVQRHTGVHIWPPHHLGSQNRRQQIWLGWWNGGEATTRSRRGWRCYWGCGYQCFYFQNQIKYFLDTFIQITFF